MPRLLHVLSGLVTLFVCGPLQAALPVYWTQAVGMAEEAAVVKTVEKRGDIWTVDVIKTNSRSLPSRLEVTGSLPDPEIETWVALVRKPGVSPSGRPSDRVFTSYVALPVNGVDVAVPPLTSLSAGVPAQVPTGFFLEAVDNARNVAQGQAALSQQTTQLKTCIGGILPPTLRPDRVRVLGFCLGALASIAAPVTVNEVYPYLHADAPELRFHALWALVARTNSYPAEYTRPVQEVVERALFDKSPNIQALALSTLLHHQTNGLAALVLPEVSWASATEVTRYSPIGRAEIRIPPPQALMVQAIGRTEATPESVAVLYQLLESPSDPVAFSSLMALEGMRDPQLKGVLFALVEKGPSRLAWMAIRSLGRQRATDASTLLAGLLLSPKALPSLREQAAHALGEIGDFTSIDALIRTLEDPSHTLAIEAARALGRVGSAQAANPVAALMGQPWLVDAPDMEVVAWSLTLLGNKDTGAVFEARLERESRPAVEAMLRESLARLDIITSPLRTRTLRDLLTVPATLDASCVSRMEWAVEVVVSHREQELVPSLHTLVKDLASRRVAPLEVMVAAVRGLQRLGEPLTPQEQDILDAEIERLGVNF